MASAAENMGFAFALLLAFLAWGTIDIMWGFVSDLLEQRSKARSLRAWRGGRRR